jgi:hypothetical protein
MRPSHIIGGNNINKKLQPQTTFVYERTLVYMGGELDARHRN